ncbi:MAG: lipopolysaccharide biosynthesis protein [Sphingomonas bacterium]|nr:lipopolysaccharide biosynthesis protein [Sphingomonas bacterium]
MESAQNMIDPTADSAAMAHRVRAAVLWRSGSQIAAQLVMWSATFLVIRQLQPSDYGLFAMSEIVIALMALLNGYSFTGALVQSHSIDRERVAQVFGALILMNFGLAALQFLLAPLAASYFRQPLVADMLRVQVLLHLFTPFIMMPQALLAREIDFRTQARVNFAAAGLAAIVGPACAYAGLGVWTLVIAPITLFGARAIGLAVLGRWLLWPSFRFRGAGAMFGFGGAVLISELLWFVQSQADIFIAGRQLDAHLLGVYSTALFLSQILVNKFVPALNDVAFPTYARMQADRAGIARAFVKSVRIILIVAMPFSLGLAATAEPLVLTVLGAKWIETGPVVRVLGLAMPFVTLQILFHPVTNALGRPGIAAWVSGAGALIMPTAFLIGVRYGPVGMATAWLAAFPLLTAATMRLSLPVIGVRFSQIAVAIRPAVGAGIAMALAVSAIDTILPVPAPLPRLLLLVASGAALYSLALLAFAPAVIAELVAVVRGRSAPAA